MFIFFPDTWRREVSRALYLSQSIMLIRIQRSRVYQRAVRDAIKRAMHDDDKRQQKLARGLASNAPTPPMTPAHRRPSAEQVVLYTEKNEVAVETRRWLGLRKAEVTKEHEAVRPSLRDVNPLPTMWSIFRRPTNLILLLSSGIFTKVYPQRARSLKHRQVCCSALNTRRLTPQASLSQSELLPISTTPLMRRLAEPRTAIMR